MTEEDKQNIQHEYNGKSASQLLHELCRLMLVLVWRFIVWLVKKFLKGLLWCIRAIDNGLTRLKTWWNDNDTQEKKAKIIAWLKRATRKAAELSITAGKLALKGFIIGLKYTGKGLKIALKYTIIGIVASIKATIKGIIHLRTTLKRLRRLASVTKRTLERWTKKQKRQTKLHKIKRQRAYRDFKRNGGVKGVIINYSNNIRKSITMFMEEDQEESEPDAMTDEELMEKALEKGARKGNRGMKIGKSILSHTKNFIDSE